MKKTQADLRTFFVSHQLLLAFLLLNIGGCAHGGTIPDWHGKLWAGDSGFRVEGEPSPGISRAKSGEHIGASDPVFDQYVSMTYADFREFFKVYVLGCKEWHKGVKLMTATQAFDVFRIVAEKEQELKDVNPQ